MSKKLINTADLTKLIKSNKSIEAFAITPEVVDGYVLHLKLDDQIMILSKYLTDKPRLFKRADALLKEAKNMGLSSVRFDI